MTAGTPAPQDAETVDVLAKAFYVAMNADDRAWAAAAWEDMGGSEPSAERADIEVAMTEALAALAPIRAREVEAARRDGARAALEQALWATGCLSDALVYGHRAPGPQSGFVSRDEVKHALESLAATHADDEQHDTKEDDRG